MNLDSSHGWEGGNENWILNFDGFIPNDTHKKGRARLLKNIDLSFTAYKYLGRDIETLKLELVK